MREALSLAESGKYADAITRFEQVFEITGRDEPLYNIAKCYEKSDQLDLAVQYLERYAARPGVSESDRVDALAHAAELRRRPSRFVVVSEPPGASVYVDDRAGGPVGSTPHAGNLSPGDHRVWVQADGHEPHEAQVLARFARPVELTVRLAALPSSAAEPVPAGAPAVARPVATAPLAARVPPAVPVEPDERAARSVGRPMLPPAWAPWLALGVAVAGTAVGGAFTWRAVGSSGDRRRSDAKLANGGWITAETATAAAAALWTWRWFGERDTRVGTAAGPAGILAWITF